MGRSVNSFARGPSRYRPQPTVLVLCEDSKSSKNYLEDAKLHFRCHVDVKIAHCGNTDPIGIVREAIHQLKSFDLVFCVIDRDTHESFDEAIALAKTAPKVTIISSYPCFEFWYFLHFGYNRKPFAAAGNKSAGDHVVIALQACEGMSKYAKGGEKSVFGMLLPRLDNARQVAPRVLDHALREGNLNPSTQVHILIDCFEQLGAPQPK